MSSAHQRADISGDNAGRSAHSLRRSTGRRLGAANQARGAAAGAHTAIRETGQLAASPVAPPRPEVCSGVCAHRLVGVPPPTCQLPIIATLYYAPFRLIIALVEPFLRDSCNLFLIRRPTEADITAEMGDDRPERIDFDTFETIARSVFRRVAVDCSKRLVVSIIGGTAAVAVLKQTLRRAPLVGCAACRSTGVPLRGRSIACVPY